ncbi:ClpXP protease specificity-enhancing factor [Aliiglaciecola sp. LCG003]|uniref:ClpXP protease specificity-enhancing factor n=1 Tax=Aliiglaciecola sp. LCG003 TaxID=3053655 RepID=UPI002573B504|nr:ClpXP protease specificity-enhancing factor [Aliiglaciecola sp. LCG003]WJG11325.1 ClpXP protease specificity-enhancing factor [Aliiglaciecola sp. LCG003]
MTSQQPYIIKAYYDWLVDNYLTPYLVVDATVPGTSVPQEFVKDGQIVLNVSPDACTNLKLGIEEISFDARFGGVPRKLVVPCLAVLAIYAKENGAGTVFTIEDELSEVEGETPSVESPKKPNKKGPPNLTVVK